jgi:hypothetical protein
MDRIKAAQLKVDRAKKHIGEFDVERVKFLSTKPYAGTPEYYVEQDVTIWFLDRWRDIPEEISLPYGDAAHNLRSALDYLWWQLIEVCGATPDPKKRPTFPILKDLQSFEEYVSKPKREVEAVVKRVEDALRRTQPYKGGNDTLWGLNELDYIDKHRFLTIATVGVSHFGIDTGGRVLERLFPGNIRLSHPLPQQTAWFHPRSSNLLATKQGDPVFAMKGNFEANQDVQFTFDIALTEPEVFKGKLLFETIFTASNVVEKLLTEFAPFLS